MTEVADKITLTLPQERDFHQVAHLVLGGLAVRLDLTIETLEDLQLALGAILDRASHEEQVTVTMSVADGILEAEIEPVQLFGDLDAEEDGDELSLGRVLHALVDHVEYEGSSIRLTKRIHG
jgi:hypothetical protein